MRLKPAGLIAALLALALAIPLPAQAKKTSKRKVKGKAPATVQAAQAGRYVEAGMAHLDGQRHTQAIANFQKAVKAKPDASNYFLLGYAHYQRGFVSGNPDAADKSDAMETVNAYSMALALDPALRSLNQPYKLYHSLALSYEALGAPDKALEAYKKAFQVAPRNPMIPLYAARLRYRMNDAVQSAANLRLSLERARAMGQEPVIVKLVTSDPLFSMMAASPEHLEVLRAYDPSVAAPPRAAVASAVPEDGYGMRDSVRGTTPAESRPAMSELDREVADALAAANDAFKYRRWREAVDGYEEVLGLNEKSGALAPAQVAFANERLGTAYNRLGVSHEAARALLRSLRDMPFNPAAYYQLSLAYAVTGHYQESLKSLREAFRTSSNPGDLRRYMLLAKTDSELDPIRDLPAFSRTISDYSARAGTPR